MKPEDFVGKVEAYAASYQMLCVNDRILAGVSGGPDSTALLRVLCELREKLGLSVFAVHVDHLLRGERSHEDARFTQELCSRLSVPCRVVREDIALLAGRRGEGLETAGRHFRYQCFERFARELGCQKIAVAHNMDDQAETFLLNLCRGSGVRGLGGIRPVSRRERITIVRPLLSCRRGEIEEYLRTIGQTWQTDETNAENICGRNRIRNLILPMLSEQINAGAGEHIAMAARELSQAEDYLEETARERLEKILRGSGDASAKKRAAQKHPQAAQDPAPAVQNHTQKDEILSISSEELLRENELLQRYMLRCLAKLAAGNDALTDFERKHVRMLQELAGGNNSRQYHLPGGLIAWKEDGQLCLMKQKNACAKAADREHAGDRQVQVEGEKDGCYETEEYRIYVRFLSVEEARREWGGPVPPEKKYTKWLAYDKMKGVVCLRTRRRGDYLTVTPEGGRKKLGDYMTDQKIPLRLRDSMTVAAQGSHILWIVGGRISEQAKVTVNTRKVICLKAEKKDGDDHG